jgi:hypothetical protein
MYGIGWEKMYGTRRLAESANPVMRTPVKIPYIPTILNEGFPACFVFRVDR